jgi:glycosyltransferase involved in cell wall biosynthesis
MGTTRHTIRPGLPSRPIRILALPRHPRLCATTRYRFLQFVPYLESCGFEIDVSPLLDREYLSVRYASGGRSPVQSARQYVRRVLQLRREQHYDLLWVEKEAFPWLPFGIETSLFPRNTSYVVDYDDAEFHRYDQHRLGVVRSLLGKKIDQVMARASLVVAGNTYIADRARRSGASHVEVLPTVLDLERYPPTPPTSNEFFTIGWIGTPITRKFLHDVAPALRELCRDDRVRLLAIGSGPISLDGVRIEVHPWSEESELESLRQIDVGIMPLDCSLYSQGKCGLKLLQYMASMRAVVGSPVGANNEIIQDGKNGFFAHSVTDWVNAIRRLQQNPELRLRMGQSGRRFVEERYSAAVVAPKLAQILQAAALRVQPSLVRVKTVTDGRA